MMRASSAIDRPLRALRSTSPGANSKMSPSRPLARIFIASHPYRSHCAGTDNWLRRRARSAARSLLDDPTRLVSPVAIAEQPFVQLAGLLARQLGIEVDGLGALVLGEMIAAVREELALELR